MATRGDSAQACKLTSEAACGYESGVIGFFVRFPVSRVLRGGSFNNQASNVRSADRNGDVPANRLYYYGFRPARTFPP